MENKMTFNYDNLKVIGVTKNGVYVQPEYIFIDSITYNDVYLLFSRKMWNNLQKQWLDSKMDFCTRYEHFCGWGSVYSNYECVGQGYRTDFDMETGEPKNVVVDIYEVLDILVDMEHG